MPVRAPKRAGSASIVTLGRRGRGMREEDASIDADTRMISRISAGRDCVHGVFMRTGRWRENVDCIVYTSRASRWSGWGSLDV